MPNLPISQLPSASALVGPEIFAVVQNGVTKQTPFTSIYTGLTGSFVTTSSFNTYTSSVQPYYLSAYHTASIPLSVTNAVYSMSYSTTDFASGISISGSDKSKIKINNPGIYDIQFSAQLDKTNSSNNTVYFWLAKNGNDEPNTNTGVALFGGANEAQVAAWNFYVSAAANDYYEIRMAAIDNNALVEYTTPALGPAVPSVILTVGRIA